MDLLLKGANTYLSGGFVAADLLIENGVITRIGQNISAPGVESVDLTGKHIFPGLVDVHVHLREPGFSYKETIFTGSRAAAASGYTDVFAMPNLDPVPDSRENLEKELAIIRKDAVIRVHPYGAITRGERGLELSDMAAMTDAAAFSDDGRGVQDEEMMRAAMQTAKTLNKVIAAHCEDNSLLHGGCIHQGAYAAAHELPGICSESEAGPIRRDLKLAKETGCRYHVCHVSAKESVEAIRQAKRDGIDATCETGPHYLVLDDSMLRDEGRFKMNPPIRGAEDRKALIDGIKDGTIEIIATDHAPHSREEKSKGLRGSLMGITGLETAFPVLYTELVGKGVIGLEKLIELMSVNPAKRFGLERGIAEGRAADLAVFDLESEYVIDPDRFLSLGRATPFEGWNVKGKCVMTLCGGRRVYG